MSPASVAATSAKKRTLASFVRGHLSTSDRLGETLCGLVTVLTFTLVASEQVDEGQKGVQQLLAATAACTVTWGLIDGVLYVLDAVSQRARRGRLAQQVRDASESEAAVLLRRELAVFLAEIGASDDDDRIVLALRTSVARAPVPGLRVERDDWLGGLAILGTQMLCCLPAVLPFVVLDDPHVALRVSNACLVLLLFAVGFQWADEVGAHRSRAALLAAVLGALLVGVSIWLGA